MTGVFFFEGPIADLLNLKNKVVSTEAQPVDLSRYNDNLYIVSSLFLYTDIIKFQYVGDTLAPLLRNVHVPSDFCKNCTFIYETPHYVPINSSTINTINIRITDELGNQIRFQKGKSFVKLHFRPIRYGF